MKADYSILYVMASSSEYGPNLRSMITPVMLGIGPIEASINLTAELGALSYKNALPDLVVNLGSAGSRILEEKEVFQVSAVSYRDMDVSLLGYEKGCTPLVDLPALVPLPIKIPGIESGTLSTGASIVSGTGYDGIKEDMVDMETFAVLRVCQKFEIPLVGLRGISDGVRELGQLSDWEQYLDIIDGKLSRALEKLFAAIDSGILK